MRLQKDLTKKQLQKRAECSLFKCFLAVIVFSSNAYHTNPVLFPLQYFSHASEACILLDFSQCSSR